MVGDECMNKLMNECMNEWNDFLGLVIELKWVLSFFLEEGSVGICS